MRADTLNVILNSWPVGTPGWTNDARAILVLDELGRELGYGFLEHLATLLRQIQCDGHPQEAISLKRERFQALGWPLPIDFAAVTEHYGG